MDYALHEVLLGGWGCPIGELFDLEKLAEQCNSAKRWSFFVTSEVCNVSHETKVAMPNLLMLYRFQEEWQAPRISLLSFRVTSIDDIMSNGEKTYVPSTARPSFQVSKR
jgi:hypothetical protein